MRQMFDIIKDQMPLMMLPTASVKHACQRMREQCVGAVLVTDRHDRLIGIFTGRDAVWRVVAEGKDPAATALADVMTPDPCCMPPTNSAIEALRLMRDGGFRHIPVVDGKKVVGIVSRGDFRGLEADRLEAETEIWERI